MISQAIRLKPFIFLLSLSIVGCTPAHEEVKVIKFSDLKQRIATEVQEVLVVNFWATFCKPCVEEMPVFDELGKDDNIKVLFVSMDFATQKALVEGFQQSEGISSEIVILNEVDYDSWIPKIDSTWSGALPATLIINTKTKNKQFKEGAYTKDQLLKTIKDL